MIIIHYSKDSPVRSNAHCTPHDASNRFIKPVMKLTKKVAKLKNQEKLLTDHGDLDIFSSIRPKVGRTFYNPELAKEVDRILKEARMKIVDISVKEKQDELQQARTISLSSMKMHKAYHKMSSRNFATKPKRWKRISPRS